MQPTSIPFSRLQYPQELTMRLDVQTVVNLGATCQDLKAHIGDDTLWAELCLRDFEYEPSREKATFFEIYKIYKRSHDNLQKGRFIVRNLIDFPQNSRCTCSNGKFILNLLENQMRIFDHKTETEISIFQEKGFLSERAITYNEKAYSSNTNGTVTIYDLGTGSLLKTIRNKGSGIFSHLAASKGVLFGYDNGKIEMWDTENGVLLNCLSGDKFYLCSLIVLEKQGEETKPISSGSDSMIRIWTPSTGLCDEIYLGTDMAVSLVLDKRKLGAVFLNSGNIKIWNVDTKECLQTIENIRRYSITSLTLCYGKIFSITGNCHVFNAPKQLQVHDIELGNLIASIELPSELNTGARLCAPQQKIFFPCFTDNKLKCVDFTKDHEAIFLNIAKEIRETGNCARFHAMPQKAKEQIYKESYLILARKESFTEAQDYWGCGDHFFNNLNGFISTPEEKAEAIENYVMKKTR